MIGTAEVEFSGLPSIRVDEEEHAKAVGRLIRRPGRLGILKANFGECHSPWGYKAALYPQNTPNKARLPASDAER